MYIHIYVCKQIYILACTRPAFPYRFVLHVDSMLPVYAGFMHAYVYIRTHIFLLAVPFIFNEVLMWYDTAFGYCGRSFKFNIVFARNLSSS